MALIFFDIDGTLWDGHMQIPESTIPTLKKLQANGHKIFLCSGRSRASISSEGCNFWNTVIDRSMYNYGEILVGAIDQHEVNQRTSDNINKMKEYTSYMSVTDSCYGTDILNAIKGGGVPSGYGSYMQEWNLWIKLEIVI